MKKFSVLLIVLAVMLALVSCASTSSADAAAPVAAAPAAEEKAADSATCPFAGEYYVEFTSVDASEPQVGESFVVGDDWSVSGAMESSGLSGFQGTVLADGSFVAEFVRLGGQMTGQIAADGTLTASSEARGRVSTVTGYRL